MARERRAPGIDLVAEKDGEAVFATVKTRRIHSDGEMPAEPKATDRLRADIEKEAADWLAARNLPDQTAVRFDNICIGVTDSEKALLRCHRGWIGDDLSEQKSRLYDKLREKLAELVASTDVDSRELMEAVADDVIGVVEEQLGIEHRIG